MVPAEDPELVVRALDLSCGGQLQFRKIGDRDTAQRLDRFGFLNSLDPVPSNHNVHLSLHRLHNIVVERFHQVGDPSRFDHPGVEITPEGTLRGVNDVHRHEANECLRRDPLNVQDRLAKKVFQVIPIDYFGNCALWDRRYGGTLRGSFDR